MTKDEIAARIAAFDDAKTNDAEHDAALALRDALASLVDDGEGDDDALEHFPFGEGFGDFDSEGLRAAYFASPDLRGADKGFYTRPRHVLEGRAELRPAPCAAPVPRRLQRAQHPCAR